MSVVRPLVILGIVGEPLSCPLGNVLRGRKRPGRSHGTEVHLSDVRSNYFQDHKAWPSSFTRGLCSQCLDWMEYITRQGSISDGDLRRDGCTLISDVWLFTRQQFEQRNGTTSITQQEWACMFVLRLGYCPASMEAVSHLTMFLLSLAERGDFKVQAAHRACDSENG